MEWLQSRAVPIILYGVRLRRIRLVLHLGRSFALALGMIVGVVACDRAKVGRSTPAALPVTRADQPVAQVRVFLISPGDQGHSGPKVGCGDSAVPVEVALPRREPGLTGALHALLALRERYQEPSGLSNPLYSSALELVRIERQGAEARIYLKGYLELGDGCDNPRILAELQETARQFSDVTRVQFYLDDRPLAEILSGQG
jgi:hypothetical protein